MRRRQSGLRNYLIIMLAVAGVSSIIFLSQLYFGFRLTTFARGAAIKGYTKDATLGGDLGQVHVVWSDRISGDTHECLSGSNGYFYGPTEVPTNEDSVAMVVNFYKQGYKTKAVWFYMKQSFYGEYDLGNIVMDKETVVFPTVPTTTLTQVYTTPTTTTTPATPTTTTTTAAAPPLPTTTTQETTVGPTITYSVTDTITDTFTTEGTVVVVTVTETRMGTTTQPTTKAAGLVGEELLLPLLLVLVIAGPAVAIGIYALSRRPSARRKSPI